MNEADRLERLAQLVVSVGANVQPGQLVVIGGMVEHSPLMREIARAAYQAGARRVEPNYDDMHFRRALIEFAPESALGESRAWDLMMLKTIAAEHAAYISVSGDAEPELLSDLPGDRVGKAKQTAVRAEWLRIVSGREVSWTIVPAPNSGWAQQMFGKPDLEALWDAVSKAMRLDRKDPVAAWRAHLSRLTGIADELTSRRFDSLRYRGPGTDFTVGLLPSGRWDSGATETAFGVTHVANMPTEEVYTSPDRRRADGRLRSTRPLQIAGTVVRDLEFELRGGCIVDVTASSGADVIRAELASDPNATRLGEISLVDDSSEVGKLDLIFFNTLFDENATCHVAYGVGFEDLVEDEVDREHGVNVSGVHTDFMVGGPEVEIDGKEPGGSWVPIMRDNQFQIM